MLELNCNGFLKDLRLYLPSSDATPRVIAFDLPDQSLSDVQGVLQGALARARKQGVTRCLMLSSRHEWLEPAIPQAIGLIRGPDLQTLFESKDAKIALWASMQTLNA